MSRYLIEWKDAPQDAHSTIDYDMGEIGASVTFKRLRELGKHIVRYEQTPVGEQALIPGVRPISERDRLESQAAAPMEAKRKQQAPGPLFGDDCDQLDLVDAVRKQQGD